MRRLLAVPALFVCGFLFLQIAWIITIPPFGGSDEIDHAYRAAAVARGEWRAGGPAENGRGNLVEVPGSLVTAAHDQCEELPYTKHDNCNPAQVTSAGNVLVASSAGAYYPPFYWLVGTAGLPFEGANALYAMRVAAALLCLVFLGLASWCLSKMPSRWSLASLVLAASPVLVYSTIVVAPNGLEMSAALSLWASLLALTQVERSVLKSERTIVVVAILSAVVLCSLRILGPIFVLLITVTAMAFGWSQFWARVRRNPRLWAMGSFLVGLAGALLVTWSRSLVSDATKARTPMGAKLEGPAELSPTYLVLWCAQSIAAFPYRNQMGPAIVYVVVGTLAILFLFVALRKGTVQHRIVLLTSLAVGLALPFALTLATLNTVGNIWQGRYGLPYGVGFVVISGMILGIYMPGHLPRWIVTISGFIYSGSVMACLIKVRADELSDNSASVSDPAWHVPPPVLIAGLVAVAFGSFWAAVTSSSGEDRAPVGNDGVDADTAHR